MRAPPLFLAAALALGCTGAPLLASDPPAPDPAPASAQPNRVRQAVADKLPKFSPPVPAPGPTESTPGEPTPASTLPPLAEGEQMLRLPDFRVTEPKIFGPDEDDWLTGAELTRKAIRLAERDMTALDLALNRWHIPLLTPSFAARARGAYQQERLDREMDRLLRLVDLSELDPDALDSRQESPFRYKPQQSIRLTLDLTKRRN